MGAAGGTGVSPKAKRAAQYIVPDPASGPEMSTATLSSELYVARAAITNMHTTFSDANDEQEIAGSKFRISVYVASRPNPHADQVLVFLSYR